MSRGPARPIHFLDAAPRPGLAHHNFEVSRPGPAHQFFKIIGLARPGTSHFQNTRPCPARPITIFTSARPGPAHRPMRSPDRNSKPLFCSFRQRFHMGRPVSRRVKARGPPHGQHGRRSGSTVIVVVVVVVVVVVLIVEVVVVVVVLVR